MSPRPNSLAAKDAAFHFHGYTNALKNEKDGGFVVTRGKAAGVALASGKRIASRIVISNADLRTTFQRLLDPALLPKEFAGALERFRGQGVLFKINLALDARPRFAAFTAAKLDVEEPVLVRIGPSIGYFERTFEEAVQAAPAPAESAEAIEHVVRSLLRRWGVIFWRLLTREADWLPPWRDLLSCCRRLEARGELRGGRFVAGFSGEQYATPEAIGLLRDVRRKPLSNLEISLSAADPLNLVGILTPDPRLPALTANRVLYRDGLPIALLTGGEVRFLRELDAKERWQAQNAILRRHVPAALADLA